MSEILNRDQSGTQYRESAESGSCKAFRRLQAWQVAQYRKAVEENKWYLSERRGREVSWREAERDFLEHGYFGLAQQWRDEYCRSICEYGKRCQLGAQLVTAA